MTSVAIIPSAVQDIMDSADERELWIVGREFERPPYFLPGTGGDVRLAKALRVIEEERITPNSDGSYTVEGSEHRTYRVAESCSCPQSQKGRSKWCYHMISVALYVEWRRRCQRAVPPLGAQVLASHPDDADTRDNGRAVDDAPLPLPPTTVEERLAAPQAHDVALHEENAPMAESYSTDDGEAPVAVLEAPRTTTAVAPVDDLEVALQTWTTQRAIVQRFLRQELKPNIDYYTLKIGGKDSKPSLSKAGAEKVMGWLKLQACFTPDTGTWEMLGRPQDLVAYVCTLRTRSGEVVGEGRGARSIKKDNGDINKAIKMAEKCLGGNTPVIIKTPKGLSLVRLNQLANRPLDTTYIAGPGATWRKLVRVEAQPSGPIRRLRFRDGFVVKASLNHRWPLLDGTLKSTADLRLGDVIPHSPLPAGDRHSDADFLWMAGLYIAEGSTDTKEYNVRFSLHAEEEGVAEHLLHIGERLGASATTTVKGNARTVWLFGPAPVGLINHFVEGRLSYGKHFRRSVWQQDPKGLKAGLMGYLIGDGHLLEREGRQPLWQLGFTRKNHEFAHDLRALCAMLGYRCCLDHGESRETTTNKRFPIYKGWLKMVESRYNASEPGEIIAIDETQEGTYEVEVDGDHLFCLANGLVTHNSACVSAVLRTGALSDVFTCDLEDMPSEPAPPAPRPTSAELRQRIWKLVTALDPQVTTREQVVLAVRTATGLELEPDNYGAIVARLEQRA